MLAADNLIIPAKPSGDCVSGFTDRFYAVCTALGMKKFGRVTFLTTISGLSWSGANVCLQDDRPPKRKQALASMTQELSTLLKSKIKIHVTPQEVEKYLLLGSGPLEERLFGFIESNWDISGISSSLNARVVLMIYKVANEMDIDVFSDLDKKQFELLNRKLTVYCHQYSEMQDMEDNGKIMELIRSMIIVAHAKLQ